MYVWISGTQFHWDLTTCLSLGSPVTSDTTGLQGPADRTGVDLISSQWGECSAHTSRLCRIHKKCRTPVTDTEHKRMLSAAKLFSDVQSTKAPHRPLLIWESAHGEEAFQEIIEAGQHQVHFSFKLFFFFLFRKHLVRVIVRKTRAQFPPKLGLFLKENVCVCNELGPRYFLPRARTQLE